MIFLFCSHRAYSSCYFAAAAPDAYRRWEKLVALARYGCICRRLLLASYSLLNARVFSSACTGILYLNTTTTTTTFRYIGFFFVYRKGIAIFMSTFDFSLITNIYICLYIHNTSTYYYISVSGICVETLRLTRS